MKSKAHKKIGGNRQMPKRSSSASVSRIPATIFDNSRALKMAAQPNAFTWDDSVDPKSNYVAFGQRLAATGDLFRSPIHGGGLILLLPDGKHLSISKAADLMPVI